MQPGGKLLIGLSAACLVRVQFTIQLADNQ